jgi:glutathione S-transferase
MDATLYTMPISHPGWSARLAFARKGIEPKVVDLPAGMHPALLWLRGYRRGTVPAARIDGRRVEGSRAIVQELERLAPQPSLYPDDPERRAAVEDAERWGDQVFQDVPRAIARHAIAHERPTRVWFMGEHAGMPLPSVAATVSIPVARAMAARAGGSETGARTALRELPAALDRVDALLADGLLGEPDAPNAAGVQLAPTVVLVAGLPDLADLVAGRPCAAWAAALLPQYARSFPASPLIAALRREAGV